MKKIILVAVAAAATAASAHADSRPATASSYVIERPDSADRSGQRAKAVVLRDRRPAEIAAVPRRRP